MQASDLTADPVERVATGFQFTEGPVWLPDGFLLFSDIPANRIYRLTPDGEVSVWREPSGNRTSPCTGTDHDVVELAVLEAVALPVVAVGVGAGRRAGGEREQRRPYDAAKQMPSAVHATTRSN